MIEVIKVSGNNEGLYTKEAYRELTLQMSTGDYYTHRHERVIVEDWTDVITLENLLDNSF